MDQTKKKPMKSIPRSDLSSIKNCIYDTPYTTNTIKLPHLHKKNINFQHYEIDTNSNFNNIKQCETKVDGVGKLPNKKYSHNNWHGNTINTASNKGDNNSNSNNTNNKIVKNIQKI